MSRAAISRSAGKDSCLALLRAREAGLRVATAVTMYDFCGAECDATFLARLPPGVCPCGEGGEFHPFVHDAPGARPLSLERSAQRRERSVAPLAPTELVFETPWLVDAASAIAIVIAGAP